MKISKFEKIFKEAKPLSEVYRKAKEKVESLKAQATQSDVKAQKLNNEIQSLIEDATRVSLETGDQNELDKIKDKITKKRAELTDVRGFERHVQANILKRLLPAAELEVTKTEDELRNLVKKRLAEFREKQVQAIYDLLRQAFQIQDEWGPGVKELTEALGFVWSSSYECPMKPEISDMTNMSARLKRLFQ